MRQVRLLLGVSIALAAVLAAAALAQAGTYQVKACLDAPGGSAGAFTALNTEPATLTADTHCPPSPGDPFSGLLVAATLGTPNTPGGAQGAWTIAAPIGTTLHQLTVRRYLGKRDSDWDVAVREADGTVLDTCEFDPLVQLGCSVGSTTPSDPENIATYGGLATPSVRFVITCGAGAATCSNGTTQRQAWIAIYGATATVEDPAPPTLGALSGNLLGPGGAGGWHHGSEQLTVPATDASGVKSVGLLVDGREFAGVTETCSYVQMQPCPGSVSPALNLDLAQIGDGPHELRATAADAADQEALSSPVTLRVDQHTPAAPGALTATANGDGRYRLAWQDPDQGAAAPIAAAHYTVCRVAEPTVCPVGETMPGAGIAEISSVQIPAGGRYAVRVWLEDAAGNSDPTQAATIAVDTTGPAVQSASGEKKPGSHKLPGGKPTRGSRLHLRRAICHDGVLTIGGTLARRATGTVTAILARTRTGRPVFTVETKARNGRWMLRIRLGRAQRDDPPRYLTLRYGGDSRFTEARLSGRLVKERTSAAPTSAGTLAEFDFEQIAP